MSNLEYSLIYSPEVLRVRNDPRYTLGESLLDDVLARRHPREEVLKELSPDVEDAIASTIEGFYDRTRELDAYKDKVRKPQNNVKEVLAMVRHAVDTDPLFQKIQGYLSPKIDRKDMSLEEITEDIRMNIGPELGQVFGQYSNDIIRITAFAFHENMVRKCEIMQTAHWMRVAGVVYALHKYGVLKLPFDVLKRYLNNGNHLRDIPEDVKRLYGAVFSPEEIAIAAASAFEHDVPEDMLQIVTDSKDKPYGLARYPEFLRDFIHKDLRETVVTVTNDRDLIIGDRYAEIKDRQNKNFTLDRFISSLSKLKRKKYSYLEPYVADLENIAKRMAKDPKYQKLDGKALKDALKWKGYKHFSDEVVAKANPGNHFLPLVDKIADWADNFLGKRALYDEDKEQIILKLAYGASAAYAKGIQDDMINYFIMELLEAARTYARTLIVSDFLEVLAPIDFHNSTSHKIMTLNPILYTGRTNGV